MQGATRDVGEGDIRFIPGRLLCNFGVSLAPGERGSHRGKGKN
jgi:hypothetical protein